MLNMEGCDQLAEKATGENSWTLLKMMLMIDADQRIAPSDALTHPFVTMQHLMDFPHCNQYVQTFFTASFTDCVLYSVWLFSVMCGVLKECVSNSVQSCFPHHGRVSLKNQHVRYFQPQQSTPTYEACDASKCSKYHCRLQQNAICPLSGKAHTLKRLGV